MIAVRNRFLPCLLSGLGICALMVGCGGPTGDRPDVGEVTGVVKMDGVPLANASVTFQPSSGRPSRGVTNEEGQYELMYIRDDPGAKTGDHSVMISTYRSADPDAEDGPVQAMAETVPAQYNIKTGLKANVKAGENEINFDLESKGEIIDPEKDDGR